MHPCGMQWRWGGFLALDASLMPWMPRVPGDSTSARHDAVAYTDVFLQGNVRGKHWMGGAILYDGYG